MSTPLPKWVMQKYAKIWQELRDSSFDHQKATEILDDNVSVILSHLRKNSWLEINLNPEDSRKRIYRLKKPEQIINEMKQDGKQ
ncbi:hypothetical protein HQ545_04555 [Candidatus Woesearchaeota archaeon]|nr:hypothetical protein [Candidatus Woesearchaeota archaeon]